MAFEPMDDLRASVRALAERFALARDERLRRTALDPEDFARLGEAGFRLTGITAAYGGVWRGLAQSVRDYCEIIRDLARADPSLALVASMHPAVLAFWLAAERVEHDDAAWQRQRNQWFDSALGGHWWGTLMSEPGSGGDLAATRTRAVAAGNAWRLTGEKHFGSGSGITSFMLTIARADGDESPDLFVIDTRGRPADGSAGIKLTKPWDGYGMMATQSHAFRLDGCPATRAASRDALAVAAPIVMQLAPMLFSAVIVGVLDVAIEAARAIAGPRAERLRAYERVAFTDGANEVWLAQQAYEGAIGTIERGEDGSIAAARAKLTIAALAETAIARLTRVVGGASYARESPFGQWLQDVRALGFLRPPWGLAHDQLLALDFGVSVSP
jgi:alkylation response protein AidB-like acyl-CoA dehydrogenase